MLIWALSLLGAAGLLGVVLAGWYLADDTRGPPNWKFGALHGVLALTGFILLATAIASSRPASVPGVAGFGQAAVAILALALVSGALPLSARLRRRRLPFPTLVIGLHATIAVTGLVIFAAYYALSG